MTVHPTRDQLRALADAATPGSWEPRTDDLTDEVDVWANGAERDSHVAFVGMPEEPRVHTDAEFIAAARAAVPRLLDQLDAAEQRIRDLTQEVRDERGAARDQMEQVRIRDARIKAVENVLDTWMTYCQTEQTARALSDIRRALNGYTET